MKQLLIFATILLVAACDKIIEENHPCVTVSDSQPVKFWPSDCATYNEQQVCGIHPKCWCLPYECDDTVPVQIQSDDQVETVEPVSNFISDMDGWFNTANGTTPATGGSTPDWAWSSDLGGSIKVTTTNLFPNKSLRLSAVSLPQQQSYVRIKFSIPSVRNSSSLFLRFIVRDSGNNQLLNQPFGSSTTGSEQISDILIASSSIWANADHFIIATNSTLFSPGDVIHITDISYAYESPAPYKLKAFNEAGELLFIKDLVRDGLAYNASFVPIEEGICDEKIRLAIHGSGEGLFIQPLENWENSEWGPEPRKDWDTGAQPHILMTLVTGNVSDDLASPALANNPGPYTFKYRIRVVSNGSNYLYIRLYTAGSLKWEEPIVLVNGLNEGEITLSPDEPSDRITLRAESFDDGEFEFTIEQFDSDDQEFYKSDCLDIRVNHDCTNGISYSNNRNIDGLVYANVSPRPEFFIRVPSVFFHQRFPSERFSTYDTGDVIHLSGNTKRQKFFETDYMPYYMHEKINKIFEHQLVKIGDLYWTSEEEYEIEDGNKRWPVKKAGTWLTQRNSYQQFVM